MPFVQVPVLPDLRNGKLLAATTACLPQISKACDVSSHLIGATEAFIAAITATVSWSRLGHGNLVARSTVTWSRLGQASNCG
jgi:hypothetical protein